ncbi:MAG: nucleoside transporter C-terminal domain-containing protein [Acetobacteraceae bacterium]
MLIALAWALSEDRRAIPWRTVLGGIGLQLLLAVVLIRVEPAQRIVLLLNRAADALQRATDAGTGFLFGYLGGGALPFVEVRPGAGFILAFKILPLVLVISALSAVLFHWGVLQRLVGVFAALLRRTLGVDGPLAVAAAVHIFVGMIEAPLLVRPYLAGLQRGELFAMMTCGMAGVAGTVMVIYGAVLEPVVPNALGTIIVASVISTPAALAIAAIMVPFTPSGRGAAAAMMRADPPVSSLDALVRGTADGVGPLVGITTSLLVTVALVALVNQALGLLPGGLTLQGLLALPLRPLVWLIGVDWDQVGTAALLMGTKTISNEFVACQQLASLPSDALEPHARVIMTYALCGFANLGSVGILTGGLAAMVPGRRAEVTQLGARSLVSGTLATCLSGAVAGLLG